MKYRIERWSYNVCTDAAETDSWDIIQDIIKTKKFSEDSDNGECIFEVFADGERVKNPVGPEPKEPLIKDEKIRKAVRAWYDSLRAVMCDGKITFYDDEAYRMFQIDIWNKYSTINNTRAIAEIDLLFDCYDLDDSKTYTIAELCGEEE